MGQAGEREKFMTIVLAVVELESLSPRCFRRVVLTLLSGITAGFTPFISPPPTGTRRPWNFFSMPPLTKCLLTPLSDQKSVLYIWQPTTAIMKVRAGEISGPSMVASRGWVDENDG